MVNHTHFGADAFPMKIGTASLPVSSIFLVDQLEMNLETSGYIMDYVSKFRFVFFENSKILSILLSTI